MLLQMERTSRRADPLPPSLGHCFQDTVDVLSVAVQLSLEVELERFG